MSSTDQMRRDILNVVALVPYGRVATYGQIARLAGYPHHARFVGRTLGDLLEGHAIAWHRIVNAQGKIRVMEHTAQGLSLQATLLYAEGILVQDGRVILKSYRWDGST